MKEYLLEKSNFDELIVSLKKDYMIYCPVQRDENTFFAPLTDENKPNLHLINTVKPPKEILFPQTEVLFKFEIGSDKKISIKECKPENTPRIIFGIRPCDAKSFMFLDSVFSGYKFPDPYYLTRRKNTLLIAFACNKPHFHCFCTSVGGGPHSSLGSDILFTELKDMFFVECVSEQGEILCSKIPFMNAVTADAREEKAELKQKSELEIMRKFELENIRMKLKNSFETPYWTEVARKCIGCGICTYLCPTCHCFDINDEGNARIRTWDSCQFSEFTMHTSAHNPRPTKMHRIRNRVYDKFIYTLEMFGELGCVGCGRCIKYCPVNWDIVQTLLQI